jgi:hypothetical protein
MPERFKFFSSGIGNDSFCCACVAHKNTLFSGTNRQSATRNRKVASQRPPESFSPIAVALPIFANVAKAISAGLCTCVPSVPLPRHLYTRFSASDTVLPWVEKSGTSGTQAITFPYDFRHKTPVYLPSSGVHFVYRGVHNA